MKSYYVLIFLILLSSCKKTNSLSQKKSIADTYYKKAKEINQDSSFYYFNLAKNAYLEEPDSVGVGRSLVNMAIIQHDNGDYYGSIETSLEANRFLKNTHDSITKRTLAASYNNMGICSSYLYDFDNSVKFYTKAIKYTNVPESKYTYYNNLGSVLITLKKYQEAKKNLKQALNTKDKLDYARALNNLARAKFNENKNYNALPELDQALKLRQEEKNPYEENSSYATLSNYFLKKDSNKALDYAKKMLEVSIKNNSKEDQLQALQKIINLDRENYFRYFGKFQSLNDSLQIARSKAKNQFAVIRYDVEVKNNENQKLKTKSFQQNVGIAFLGLLLIGGFFWYKKRKKRILLESENRMQEHQLRTSKKVHDVVANGIYQVMTKIENQREFDKEQALDELEFVYEKSRDISYDDHEVKEDEKDFGEKISTLIASFKNDTVNTYVAGNDDKVWQGLKPSTETEIYQIIREMLVNMKKHSQADRVAFKFERANQEIEIQYSDNGIGMDGNAIFKNGLQNMDSRIEAIGGKIIFDTETEKGLKIKISFPVS